MENSNVLLVLVCRGRGFPAFQDVAFLTWVSKQRLFYMLVLENVFCYVFTYASIAQLVEHITDTDGVQGSNPCTRTT
jgi:hypothetical protein